MRPEVPQRAVLTPPRGSRLGSILDVDVESDLRPAAEPPAQLADVLQPCLSLSNEAPREENDRRDVRASHGVFDVPRVQHGCGDGLFEQHVTATLGGADSE